ncbi:ostA-like protein [Prevotella sp. CAG:891]|nr:ostA-like protein [Prevotella sp. CAG:891]
MKRSLLYFFLLTVLCSAFAMPEIHKLPQPAQHAKPEPEERIILKHADNLRFNENEMQSAQRLSGNVVLMHKGMTMFCDSAMLYEQSQTFDAFGHVKIVQGDTLTLTGDRLHYDGETLIAEMRFNVIMTHRNQKLYTDSLYYDRLYNMGYYEEGGKLIDGKNQLTSDWGEYHTDTRQATFNYNVELINDRFKLITDTLHYDTQTKWAEVVGASNIYSNADTLYTEHGFYNSDNEQVKLYKRSKAYGRNRIMEGDTVYYDKKTGVMEAFQNVSCLDEKNKNLLTGDYAWYNELTGEAIATKNALARDFSQGKDTLYFHADTLHMYSYNLETDSAYRVLHAYFHARAYREDVQAVADSMVFHSAQKKITLFRDPIAWSDQRQIVGEEINVYLNDSTIDSVYVDRQALMIEKLDSTHFNQVGAQQMRTYFVKGEVSENRAVGNVMVVNYPLEKDSTIIYQNYVETAEARMFMKDRKLKKIWAPASHGFFYPIGMAPAERTRLEGFAWFDYIRPISPDDVFKWRGKKAGTALKPSIRREAPLQNL